MIIETLNSKCIKCKNGTDECRCNGENRCASCKRCSWCIDKNFNGNCVSNNKYNKQRCPGSFGYRQRNRRNGRRAVYNDTDIGYTVDKYNYSTTNHNYNIILLCIFVLMLLLLFFGIMYKLN